MAARFANVASSYSNRARDIRDALLREAGRVGVELRTDCRVLDVSRQAHGFEITTQRGEAAAVFS